MIDKLQSSSGVALTNTAPTPLAHLGALNPPFKIVTIARPECCALTITITITIIIVR